ncbi:MAG: division/cell wall cluster transcriptional repressor MraZ [Calditrichia bacterium]
MAEYYGTFRNILDSKGRVNMPARFRDMDEIAGNDEHIFILTRGSEPYIAVFPLDEWRRINQELDKDMGTGGEKRNLKRYINYFSSQQKVDKQGRLNLPQELIKYAQLEKEVVLIGTGNKIEIWNPKLIDTEITNSEFEYRQHAKRLDF